jgi:hypothetical protein
LVRGVTHRTNSRLPDGLSKATRVEPFIGYSSSLP